MLMHYFFMLGWAWCGLYKKRAGIHFAELMFLHSRGSVCHIVHSGVSRMQNIDALFFMLGWVWYRFDKKRIRTCDAEPVFLHPVASVVM
jgi:hypothetical protein